MEIFYANSRIQKVCTDGRIAQKELGKTCASILVERLLQIEDAGTLEELRFAPGGWHELKGDRKGQLACSLQKRLRLIFTPANDPRPTKPDSGLDWSQVTAVVNLEIIDYH